MTRPWEEIAPGEVSACELSEACRQTLPDAKLRVAIEAEATDPGARRITVEIDWQVNALRARRAGAPGGVAIPQPGGQP